jgi:hypothetical protein
MTGERADAVVVPAIFFPKAVADLAIKYRLPVASIVRPFADDRYTALPIAAKVGRRRIRSGPW